MSDIRNKTIDYLNADVNELIDRAFDHLSASEYRLAKSILDFILIDHENPVVYLGEVICEQESTDPDKIMSEYERMYFPTASETLEAVEPDRKKIQYAETKYYIEGKLERQEIGSFFDFDGSYESNLSSLKLLKDELNDTLANKRLINNLEKRKAEDIVTLLNKLTELYQDKVAEAENSDRESIKIIQKDYVYFLQDAEEKLRKKYLRFSSKKSKEYLELTDQYDLTNKIEDYQELIEKFREYGNYRNAPRYVDLCKEKIDGFNSLDAKIKVGEVALSSNLYAMAKKCFEEALEINDNSTRANMGYLMASLEVNNKTDLIKHYIDMFDDNKYEKKYAEIEDQEHINNIAKKYKVKNRFSPEQIKNAYTFDFSYDSCLDYRLKQKESIRNVLLTNDYFRKLIDLNDKDAVSIIKKIEYAYDMKISDAQNEDRDALTELTKKYKEFLESTDEKVIAFHDELLHIKKPKEVKPKEVKKPKPVKKEKKKEDEIDFDSFVQTLKSKVDKTITIEETDEEDEEIEEEKPRKENSIEFIPLRKKKAKEETAPVKKEKLKKQETVKPKQEIVKKETIKEVPKKQEDKKKIKPVEAEKKTEEVKVKQPKKIVEQESEKEGSFMVMMVLIIVLALGTVGYVGYTRYFVPKRKYDSAIKLLEEKQYDEANLIFRELEDYSDSAEKAQEALYLKALDLYDTGKKVDAINTLRNLDYSDSKEKLQEFKDNMIKNAKVGDTVVFGLYEQDGDRDNDREYIEWIVLRNDEDGLLLLSKYGLDGQKFDSNSEEIYWEDCSLRFWLNNRFADNAFGSENTSLIQTVTLQNYRFDEEGEELIEYETDDSVFLLSSQEVEDLISDPLTRICEGSKQLLSSGSVSEINGNCNWWLRTPNVVRDNSNNIINDDGDLDNSMYEITNAIRPAIVIKQ